MTANGDVRRRRLARALGEFWEGGAGPSHRELSKTFTLLDVEGCGEEMGSKLDRVELAIQGVEDARLTALVAELLEMLDRGGAVTGDWADERRNARLTKALAPFGLALGPGGELQGAPSLGVDPADLLTLPAVRDHVRRIQVALQEEDAGLLLGSAKELLESTSKFVLTEQDLPIPDKFPSLLTAALRCLELHPKSASDAPEEIVEDVKRILGGLQQIGIAVNNLRNEYGTGHGRASAKARLGIRHARLAAGSAAVLATIMIDTFEALDAPWRRRAAAATRDNARPS